MRYSVISVTTPAPTVPPPSRIANRPPSSPPTPAPTPLASISPPPSSPTPPPHRHPPLDRKHVLERHQKRLVARPHRRRNVAVHRRHQLPDAPARLRVLRPLHRPQRRPPHHRNRVPRKLVLLQ